MKKKQKSNIDGSRLTEADSRKACASYRLRGARKMKATNNHLLVALNGILSEDWQI